MTEIIRDYWKEFLFSDGHRFTGIAVTLWLLVLCLTLGFVIAWPLALAMNSKNVALRCPALVYSFVIRGTPLYVQLLIVYTGLYSLAIIRGTPYVNEFFRSGFNCTVVAFGLNTAAYAAEIFAGAIRSAPKGEFEACWSLGMTSYVAYRRVIIPLAFRRALPAYSNEVILMLHATSLAFTATVPDIFKVARDLNAATYASFTAFGMAAGIYLGISFALVGGFRLVERKLLVYSVKAPIRPAAITVMDTAYVDPVALKLTLQSNAETILGSSE